MTKLSRRTVLRYSFLSFAICASLVQAASAGAAAQVECARVALQKPPAWISGAAWSPKGGGQLAVVDALSNALSLYNARGKLITRRDEPVIRSWKRALDLTGITPFGDYFLAKLRGAEFLPVRARGTEVRVEEPFFLGADNSEGGAAVRSVYDWVVVGEDTILAYGSVNDPGEKYGFKLGFLKARFGGGATTGGEVFLPSRDHDYYALGFSYLAAVGDDGYFVSMEDPPVIYRMPRVGEREAAPLGVFPPKFDVRPSLEGMNEGPGSAERIFAELAKQRMPTGLIGHKGYLYLLARDVGAGGEVSWHLYQIAPEMQDGRGTITGSVRLPTSTDAQFLTVVPADERWLLIERGAVDSYGRQDIRTLVSVPSEWIEGSTNSPLSRGHIVECSEY